MSSGATAQVNYMHAATGENVLMVIMDGRILLGWELEV